MAGQKSIIALVNANLIIEQNLVKTISLRVCDDVIFSKDKFSPEEWAAMKKTADLFTRIKSTQQAEMIATVLYSYDELKTHKGTISDKDVYDHIMVFKPHWRIEKEFEVCDTIHNLAILSLISVEYTNSLMDT